MVLFYHNDEHAKSTQKKLLKKQKIRLTFEGTFYIIGNVVGVLLTDNPCP